MDTIGLYSRIYGWVESVLNPPSVSESDKIPIGISGEDFAALTESSPFIVIGYTPTALISIGNGGTRLPVQEKSSEGYWETVHSRNELVDFHNVIDGEFSISVDGDAVVDITGIAFDEALSFSKVAQMLQAEITAVVGVGRVIVEFHPNGIASYFVFTSLFKGSGSSIVLSVTGGAGTDILDIIYLNNGVSVVGIDDTDTEQIYLTDYEADVEIRQVYGEGEYLQQLVNSKWLNSTAEYFRANKFSLNDIGPIQGIPYTDGHKTVKESMMACKFSFFGVSKEDIYTIETIAVNGVLMNEDSSRSHIISIGG